MNSADTIGVVHGSPFRLSGKRSSTNYTNNSMNPGNCLTSRKPRRLITAVGATSVDSLFRAQEGEPDDSQFWIRVGRHSGGSGLCRPHVLRRGVPRMWRLRLSLWRVFLGVRLPRGMLRQRLLRRILFELRRLVWRMRFELRLVVRRLFDLRKPVLRLPDVWIDPRLLLRHPELLQQPACASLHRPARSDPTRRHRSARRHRQPGSDHAGGVPDARVDANDGSAGFDGSPPPVIVRPVPPLIAVASSDQSRRLPRPGCHAVGACRVSTHASFDTY